MGFFSSPEDKYSSREHNFTTEQIKRIFNALRLEHLHENEEDIVEAALIERKGNDGKISLRQIYNVFHHLKQEGKISKIDEHKLMEIFVEHFKEFDK